jgi:hypothetical protein
MTKSQKFGFFLLALVTMGCFAIATVVMAEGKGGLAIALYVLAFVIVGCGFTIKRRILPKQPTR